MNRKGRLVILTGVLLSCLAFQGCENGTPIKERVIVQNAGVDRVEGGYELSINAFLSDFAGDAEGGTSKTAFLSREGSTIADALGGIGKLTGRLPFFSHNQAVVIGEETARDGLEDILDFFSDYFECRPNAGVFLTEGTAKEALELKGKDTVLAAKDLQQLSQTGNLNGTISETTVYEVAETLGKDGMAVCIPILSVLEEGEDGRLYVEQSGLVKEGRLVDFLTPEETMGVMFLNNEIRQAGIYLHLEEGDAVTVGIMNAKTDISVGMVDGNPEFTVHVFAEGEPVEKLYRKGEPLDDDFFLQLNLRCEEEIKQNIESAIRKTVISNQADALHLGDRIRQTFPDYWKENELQWSSKISDCDFKITVDTNIRKLGHSLGG